MAKEPEESGIDELMRLSQQFARQDQENREREEQRANQRKKAQDVLGGLRDLKVNMAVEQLKLIASPDVVARVDSLKSGASVEELRHMLTDLAEELETQISSLSAENKNLAALEVSIKTLTILMELYFSLR